MPPEKDEKSSTRPLNTSAQIQQIFTEVQLQLPSVNFDNDDDDDDDAPNAYDNEEILESNIPENTEALLESLSTNHGNSFLMLNPKTETLQQPPSVELQMRVSPNLFDNSLHNQDSPPKPSFLSMDLFNSIDFEKLISPIPNHDPLQHTPATLTRTFNRPRPATQHTSSSQKQTNSKHRDDHQILERLAQQANKFNINERSNLTREHRPFRNLESALYATSHEHVDRHGKRTGIPESERKTIYIDLRNSNVQQKDKAQHEQQQQSTNMINSFSQQTQSSESESDDDDRNDGMLWFEKRQQAKRQQQLNGSEK